MTYKELENRMIEIRRAVNRLCDDLGSTYDTAPEMLEKVLNVALNGDFCHYGNKGGAVFTHNIITVADYRKPGAILNGKYEYISFQEVKA